MGNSNASSIWNKLGFPFDGNTTRTKSITQEDLEQEKQYTQDDMCKTCQNYQNCAKINLWELSNKYNSLKSEHTEILNKLKNIESKHAETTNMYSDLLSKYTDLIDKYNDINQKQNDNNSNYKNIIEIESKNSTAINDLNEALRNQVKTSTQLTRRVSYLRSISKYCTSCASIFVLLILVFLSVVVISSIAYLYLLKPELTKEVVEKIINIYSFIISTAIVPLGIYGLFIFFLFVDVKSIKNKIDP